MIFYSHLCFILLKYFSVDIENSKQLQMEGCTSQPPPPTYSPAYIVKIQEHWEYLRSSAAKTSILVKAAKKLSK